ncbi:MAG: 8-amino-7-oxononanoate synthase [Actinomycetota bacterium]|nr:8-amino-7-oxononanoate synthase [Actinomycetota bacterium]
MDEVDRSLAALERAGLRRRLRAVSGAQGPRVRLDEAEVLLLCSNNYLGLADHPRVRRAAAEAAERYGAGAGASRLISGDMELHRALEKRLAAFKGTEAALLFGSGYLANLGIVSALAAEGGVVCSDELNHASIIDGCRLARAETFVYRHRDVEHLAWGLEQAKGRSSLIVTDGVFSMDGDVAPLPAIAEVARRYGSRMMVDEAHGTGAIGPGGRGTVAAAGLEGQVDVVVGTLGKALGSYGAYACTSARMRELLINRARPFIYSTAPPPPSVGAALAALTLLESRPGVVEHLRRNAAVMRQALGAYDLDVADSRTQIVPVMVGDARRAVALCERALDGGVFAQAIRPPTVPEGTSRLRLTVMANHRADELQAAARVIGRAARDLGIARGQAHLSQAA